MTRKGTPQPDDAWSKRAKRFWCDVFRDYLGLEVHQIELLHRACEQLTIADAAQEAFRKHGPIIKDRFGQLKDNPAVDVARKSTLCFQRIIKDLGLNEAPEAAEP